MEPGDQFDQLRRQPGPVRALEAPLFERLSGGGPAEAGLPPDCRALDREEAIRSVGRELGRLFNTRLAPGRAMETQEASTVTGFGIPDWSAVNPASAAELRALSEVLAEKAAAFEPRLEQIRVELRPDPANRRRAYGNVEGVLRLGWALERVSFELSLGAARIQVGGAD